MSEPWTKARPRTAGSREVIRWLESRDMDTDPIRGLLLIAERDIEREVRASLAEKVRALPGTPWRKGGNDSDDMCPNCVTPWKCNGPHEPVEREPDGFDVDRAAVLRLLQAPDPLEGRTDG